MAEREEVRQLLWDVFYKAEKWLALKKLKLMMQAEGFDDKPYEFILNTDKVIYLPPAPRAAAEEADPLMGPILQGLLSTGCQFDKARDPEQILSFLGLTTGPRELRWSQFSPEQRAIYRFADGYVRTWKNGTLDEWLAKRREKL